MVSSDEVGNKEEEIQEEPETATTPRLKLMDYIPIYIPTVEDGLLDEAPRERRFLDFLKASPSGDWFLKFGFLRQNPDESNGLSPADGAPPATLGGRRRFRVPFVRKINWAALLRYGKQWIKNPMNMAFLAWLLAVAAGLLVMLLVMTGILNEAIPESSRRKKWVEVDTQILNALFTIICLYQHPKLVHHLVLLLRWRPADISELRRIYSKKGVARPHERVHMAVVVALLHVTCLSQYALCGLYWGFKRTNRPDYAENLCVGVGVAAPVAAGVYMVFGPLGRKVAPEGDEESQRQAAAAMPPPADTRQAQKLAARVRHRRVVVTRPEWVGGLFDCWDDVTVAALSFFCTCCVFGWNMERLGFGNMYVHIVTFVLVIIAPFWVFNVAALNIDDDVIREAVGITGIGLCVLGLLYGGFWRIQMRKKFKLPGNGLCCGRPSVTDCFRWLFCWSCSLAQEVRTGNFYDIEEDIFYRKQSSLPPSEEEEGSRRLVLGGLLPHAGGSERLTVAGQETPVRSYSCPPKITSMVVVVPRGTAKVGDFPVGLPKDGEATNTENSVMAPPVPPSMRVEHNGSEHPGRG